jgi:hypothetical protein
MTQRQRSIHRVFAPALFVICALAAAAWLMLGSGGTP